MDFDSVSTNYREIHDKNLKGTGYSSSYFAERKAIELSRHIKEREKIINILDFGCGDGLVAEFLKKYFPFSYVSGFDISEKNIKAASSKNILNSEFKVYDGRKIPRGQEEFDIILLSNILHHVTGPRLRLGILKECHRTLKLKGKLFIFEHNPYNPLTLKIVKDCPFDRDAKLINPCALNNLLKRSGFISKLRFIIFFPGFVNNKEFLEGAIWWLPFGGLYYSISNKI